MLSQIIRNNRYLISALIFAVLNMAAIFCFFGFQWYDDSPDYIEVTHWLQGTLEMPGNFWYVLTPLGSLIALPFEFLGAGAGLIVQNILFYFLSAYLIFRIIQLVFRNDEQALIGTVLFVTAPPIIYFGLSYMTDMGAWFFYILSVFLTLLYFKNKQEKLILINGFLAGVGTLIKADGGLGILFFMMMVLFSGEFSFKEKFFKALKFGASFLLPVMAYQTYLLAAFHTTSLSEYLNHRQAQAFFTKGVEKLRVYPGSVYSQMSRFSIVVYAYAGEFLKAFGIPGLLFSLIGLKREWLHKNKERIKIYLTLFIPSLLFLFYAPTNSRFAFLSAIPLILLASSGLVYLKDAFSGRRGKLITVFLLAGCVVFNYYFCIVGSYRLIFLQLINFIKP